MQGTEQMKIYRPSWVEISLENLRHNCRIAKQLAGEHVKVAAVVKANGYGHGAVEVSKACLEAGAEEAAGLGVDEQGYCNVHGKGKWGIRVSPSRLQRMIR